MATDTETLLATMEKVARQLLVAVQRVRRSPEKPQPPAAAVAQAAAGKCLACNGENQPADRGLKRGQCANCYPKTLRRLSKGKLIESQLIAAGKLLPAGVGGRRDKDFPLDALVADTIELAGHVQNKEQKPKRRTRKAKRD